MQRRLTFLACLFICASNFAQEFPFVYYTPKDGLINSRVRRIKQDSKGRMLFMTYGGLSIYDGTKFINYSKPEGLATELVNDIVEAGPDSLLIATNTDKLNTLVRGKIGIYQTSDHFCPVINRFFKSGDGNWYAAADDGLYLFSNRTFTRLPLLRADGTQAGKNFDRILEWKNYFLLSSWNPETKDKMILYDRVNRKVLDVNTTNNVFNCLGDLTGRIWVSTSKNLMLVDTLALERGKINFQPIPEKYKPFIKKNAYFLFDRENNLWTYNTNGIVRISSQFQKQLFTTGQGLKTTILTDLFIDKEGIVWIATDGNGIMKIKNDNIELLNKPGSQPVYTMNTQNDTVWVSGNNTISRFYRNEWRSFYLPGEKTNISNLFSWNQQLYLGDEKKLVCIENKDLPGAYQHPKILIDPSTHGMILGTGLIDENGAIILYAKKNDSLCLILVVKDKKIVCQYQISEMVDQMITDKKNRLWLATRNNHLMAFSLHPGQPAIYLQLIKDYAKELPEMSPRCLTFDTSGNLWIGTRSTGVFRLTLDGLKIISAMQFNTQNGLTDNFAYSINCDRSNTIWVGTQTGLDKIFLKNGQFIIGNISKSNDFFQSIHKIIITKNNTVWALTGEGSILKIAPSSQKSTSQTPQFLFTSLQVNNHPYTDSGTNFSHKQNSLSFNVAALSFIDERSINYSYLLEGSGNNSWSKPSGNSNFNFINLPPGRYTLKVKSDFPQEIYPTQIISYSFTIQPPWWETWWLRILTGLLLVGLLISLVRFYYRRKLEKQKRFLEKQQAIEKERTRIATDMHDDLGAGLSRIKFLSETIGIKKQKQQPFEEDITKIREYSHEMIDKMGEIVWALNEKNDSLSDLLSYTRSYTVEYLSQSGVNCAIDSPELLPTGFVSGEYRRNVFLSVKEILHNIVKHSQANHVNIVIEINHYLSIKIGDDGIGFDRSKIRPYSNGLVNIEKRMKEIGGVMEIQNENGTTIRLKIPLP